MDTASLQPSENPLSAAVVVAAPASLPEVAAVVSDANQDNPGPPPPPKRQRRPSVRLGDIGDQYDSHHVRRTKQQQQHQPQQNFPSLRTHRDLSSSKPSSVKARSITNLVNGNRTDFHGQEMQEERNIQNDNGGDGLDFGYPKAKARRGTTKRVRSNWVSSSSIKPDEGSISREDGDEEGFRNFDPDYDSPEEPLDTWNGQRRPNPDPGPGRVRVSNSELDYNVREFDSRGHNNNNDGVMSWLIELGLSRYAPVFEIHEVDDEVLPMLTLEDLKDMGITAVGSRRKLYSSILKLRRGLS